MRDEAQLNGTIALIAVQRWRLVHGSLPENLEEAVRETGIQGVPIDPYSNGPLRYRVIGGEPVIYSVGSDQKDDGGTVDWKGDTQPGDFIFRISRPRQWGAP